MYLKVHALWTERRNPVRASSELLRMLLPHALQVNTQQIPCRFKVVYPRRNRALFESVRRHGALISEYYLGEAPLAWRFPARNRIIAGLAGTVVVVEAPEHSGALITARPARQACASAGARTDCSPTAQAFCGTYQSSSMPWRGSIESP